MAVKLSDIAAKMRKLDICMMTTADNNGRLTSRPMSNNGDVEYDGNSWFYSLEESEVVKELRSNPNVCLSFQGSDMLYITLTGNAKLINDKETLKKHWVSSLDRWFKDGADTHGIIMIHVKASNAKYWHNEESGEVNL